MRLRDGKCECDRCGAVVDVPPGEVPYVVTILTRGQPDYAVLVLRGRELHRCQITPDEDEPTR
jgi:hypothetical protein